MKNLLVYGLSLSGKAVIENKKDYNVYIFDDNYSVTEKTLKEYNYVNVFPGFNYDNLKDISLIVISPAISIYNSNILLAKKMGIKVISEVEYAYQNGIISEINVTGSNGKSTTVKFIEYALNRGGYDAIATGNIGIPLTGVKNDKILVNEISSFQLEAIDNFHSHISVITNVTPNHLDRHKNFETYLSAKLNLIKNSKKEDYIIVNFDDENLKKINGDNVYYFSTKSEVKGAFCDKNGDIYINFDKKDKIINKNELGILGEHNVYNILAGIIVCYIKKINKNDIIYSVKNFKGLKYRVNVFLEKDGIKYVDDSKSTSIDSCLASVKCFTSPLVLLLGGSDKGLDYKDMFLNLPTNVKCLVIYGKTKYKMVKNLLESKRKIKYYIKDNLYKATIFGAGMLKSGDVLLLSPATSSFDEFKNFMERGDFFEKTVREVINDKN